jgi:protein-arginine kinase activator protein McsA
MNNATIAIRTNDSAPETVEYMVCDDCRIAIANDDYSAMSDERANDVEDGIMQLSTMGHLMSGDSYDDFSIKSCECCGDRSAGARYGVNQFVSDEA